ncbi:MAG: tetratricopeptide repeat protein [Anaerolineae bacterium]
MTEAIQLWESLDRTEAGVTPALAEAYFRRALAYKADPQQQLADLRQAVALAPDEPRYQYHLALALHRRGEVAAALPAYRAALAHDPKRPGAAFAAALAAVEEDGFVDLNSLPGLSEQERAVLETLAALLQGAALAQRETQPSSWLTRLLAGFIRPTDHATALWRGLALLNAGDVNGAREALAAAGGARAPRSLEAVRHYYAGVAAALANDLEAARGEWEAAWAAGMDTSWLRDNLRILYTEQAVGQVRVGARSAATKAALAGLQVAPGSAALTEIAVTGLDGEAQAAAGAGNWKTAAERWSQARELLGAATGVGSPRPILHNLALAYERLEQWQAAAETWRAMLRTRPRRKAAKEDDAALSEAQWAWVRKRVIANYKQAGNPVEAVTVFRQAIKADPDDMDARLQLVDALVANEQVNAAQNELGRILERDPSHVEARLRMAELHLDSGALYAAQGQLAPVLEQKPTDPPLRQRLIHNLIELGEEYHDRGLLDMARNIFEQTLTYAPDEPVVHIALGEVAFDERRWDRVARGDQADPEPYYAEARAHLDRALTLAPDQLDIYLRVFQGWVIEHDMAAARGVLARALSHIQPTPPFFVSLGLACLVSTAPPTPITFMGMPPAPVEAPPEWRDFAVELFERAIALRPDDPLAYRVIVDSLLRRQPALALAYAERLARLTPDDPEALLALGTLQALQEQVAAAKATLRQALQLARRQRNRDLEQLIQTLRQDIDNPMFPLLFRLGPLDLPDDVFDDLDWM